MGIAIKGAFAIVKAVKPGFGRSGGSHARRLLAARLDPFYQSQSKPRDVPCRVTLPKTADRLPKRCLASPISGRSGGAKPDAQEDV